MLLCIVNQKLKKQPSLLANRVVQYTVLHISILYETV